MEKTEIIVLILTIFVSVSFLCLKLNKLFLNKPKKEKKVENETKPVEVKQEEKKEETVEKPNISVALQDEFDEYKKYLQARINSNQSTDDFDYSNENTPKLTNYDYSMKNKSKIYDDFDTPFSSFDDDFKDDFEFKKRKREKQKFDFDNLPNDIKILMTLGIFDRKF